MPGGREMRWLARYPQYCVTVVEGAEPARVLAGFGAVPEDAVDGGRGRRPLWWPSGSGTGRWFERYL